MLPLAAIVRGVCPKARPRRPFRCELLELEERWTPAIDSLGFAATTPTAGHFGAMQLSGLIQESPDTPVSPGGVTARFVVTDSASHVTDQGPIPLQPVAGEGFLFSLPLKPLAPPGSEVVTVTVQDQDGSVSGSVNVVLGTHRPAAKDIFFDIVGSGQSTQGVSYGTLAFTATPQGDVTVAGRGSFVADGTSMAGHYHLTGSGSFSVLHSAQGLLKVSAAGTLRASAQNEGGSMLDTSAQGHLNFTRALDQSIHLAAGGRLKIVAQSDTGSLSLQGRGRLTLDTTGQGDLTLGLKATLSLTAHLNSDTLPPVLG